MNTDMFAGMWKQLRGKVQQTWGDLTDDELDKIQGKRTEFEGLLQKKYGYSKEKAQQEVDNFLSGSST